MRRRGALRRRYGRAHARLKWQRMPGVQTQAFTMTPGGRIYTVTLDSRNRKWVLSDTDGMFAGSAIRKRDAQKIAERMEAGR